MSERFKFDFVDTSLLQNKSELKAKLFTFELIRNKQKQVFKKKEKISNQIEYHSNTFNKTKSNKIKERKQKTLLQLNSIKQSLEEASLGGCAKRPIENRISCKRASSILGFKSPKTIVNLHKKSQQLNLLSVKKQISLVAESISKIEFSARPEFKDCYWKFGKVFRNECNTYFFDNIKKTGFDRATTLQAL